MEHEGGMRYDTTEGGMDNDNVEILGGVIRNMGSIDITHYKTMKKSIREIDYFYRIANIQDHMKVNAQDHQINTSNYENILGEEAGYMIDQIQKRYNSLLEGVNGSNENNCDAGTWGGVYAQGRCNVGDNFPNFNKSLYRNVKDFKAGAGLRDNEEEKKKMDDIVEGYKFLIEYIRSAEVDMLEAAQALDLYLSKFTKDVQLTPDQIKEFSQVLEQIEIVAKWFTDKSGDKVVSVFEAFSKEQGLPNININGNNASALLNLDEQQREPRNDLQTTYQLNDHYYESLNEGRAGNYYRPRVMTRDQVITFVKLVENSFKNVRALENVFNTFSKVNVNTSNNIQTFMASGAMFRAFMKYSIASVISVGYLKYSNDNKKNLQLNDALQNVLYHKLAVGLRPVQDKIVENQNVHHYLNPLEVNDNSILQGDICDRLFEMCIKSMTSKIFVVVGTYSLFQRPAKDATLSPSLVTHPLRQILGGAHNHHSMVRVIPEATELYVRLPLLAEWYRKVFDFNNARMAGAQGNQDPLISFVPDTDSVWGDLCRVIFLEASNIEDGSYPMEYANKIIEAINKVYEYYNASGKMNNKQIIQEFVLDVNRRYGFLMRAEIDKYLEQRFKHISTDVEYPDDERVDYDLVDTDNVMGRQPAPSDRFRTQTRKSDKKRAQSLEHFQRAVVKFRQAIEQQLTLQAGELNFAGDEWDNANFRKISEVSLNGLIRQTQRKLEDSKESEDKHKIVLEQLHGVEKFGDVDQQKLLVFHESVVTPLTILYYTYLVLNDYNKFCNSLNVPVDHNDSFYGDFTFNQDAMSKLLEYNQNKFKGANNPHRRDINQLNEILYNVQELQEFVRSNQLVPRYYMNNQGDVNPQVLNNGGNEVKQRFFFQNAIVMETLLRKLMSVGCDMNELTEIFFTGQGSASYPVVNFGKLEQTCTHLFNNVKEALNSLRKYLPIKIVERIESTRGLEDPNSENKISMFYLQEHLFDRLFKNKYGNGLTHANEGLKNIWKVLTKKYSFNNINNADRDGAAIEGENKAHVNNYDDFYYNSFNSVFSKLGFWDVTNDANDVFNLLGLRPLVKTQETLEFPAAFAPGFKTGAILSAPKTKVERQEYTDRMIMDGAVPESNLNPLDESVLVMVKNNNEDDRKYNAFYGVHNLYDYSDETDKNHQYNFAEGDNLYPQQSDMTAQADENRININENLHTSLGLLPKFNNLLYKYVSLFMDKSTRKIYKPLLEKFTNGYNAKDVLQGKNINDRLVVGSAFEEPKLNAGNLQILRSAVCQSEPQKGAVLFASLANALKGIMVTQMSNREGGTLQFVEDNFGNINEYQKELMRAYLPAFEKELNLLVKKAEFLRKCLEETQVKVYKYVSHRETANLKNIKMNDGNKNYTQSNMIPKNNPQENKNSTRKSYLIGIYNDLIASSKSLLRCVNDVQKELNDIPLYFETYKESIIDYNNRNGTLPLMPLSHITHLMNMNLFRRNENGVFEPNDTGSNGDINNENSTTFKLSLITNPNESLGSSMFKFTYGTRGLLHYNQKPSLEFAPGVTSLLENYNNKVGGTAKFDKSLMESLSHDMVLLSRWTLDCMYHKPVLGSHNWGDMRRLVLNSQKAQGGKDIAQGFVRNLSCQTAKAGPFMEERTLTSEAQYWSTTSNIVTLVDNDNLKQSVYRLISCLYANDTTNKLYGADRQNFRIYNILDLNIVPINVHALQREVPFVNLFNYAYTFDHMIKNFIGVITKGKQVQDIHGYEPVQNDNDEFGNPAFTENDYNEMKWHPEDSLVRYMMYPLGHRMKKEFINNVYSLMVGKTSLTLNKPKYLSDQLWNKVLLQNVYYQQLYDDEMNPQVQVQRDLNDARRTHPLRINQEMNAYNRRFSNREANNENNDATLYYMTKSGELKNVDVNNLNNRSEGYNRYNSKLVRWLEWFVQTQRVVRLLMRDQLSWIGDVVVRDNDAIDEKVTEYENNNVFDLDEFQ
jgi:hypothetical protein